MEDHTPDHTPERTSGQADSTRSAGLGPRARSAADRNTQVGWGTALRRAVLPLLPTRRGRRVTSWSYVVPLVLFLAGLLFVTTAETARGTDLRNDRRVALSELIAKRQAEVDGLSRRRSRLGRSVEDDTRRLSASDGRVSDEQARADRSRAAAGLTAVHGPGLTVRLNDAPTEPDGSLPNGATPDDVVVHQQDVQAVVNALWAGGAEAMSIMGVRVISTSAVRCVGNTLLLHDRVYSPPFEIVAIGDPQRLLDALDRSEGVRLYRAAADDFGLGYDTAVKEDVTVPAFDGAEGLSHARARR